MIKIIKKIIELKPASKWIQILIFRFVYLEFDQFFIFWKFGRIFIWAVYQDTQVKIREGERRENPQAEKTADKKPARGQARNFVLFS